MPQTEQRAWTDEELAALFDRFFAPLYDVAVRVLGSDDEAGAAVGRAVSRALVELRRRPVDDLRPWLYGLLAAELPRKPASSPSDERFVRIDPDRLANPERLVHEEQIVAAVWTAASALPTDDYLLLDLQLRHGLRDPELGRALRLDCASVDRRLERLRDQLDDAVESPSLAGRRLRRPRAGRAAAGTEGARLGLAHACARACQARTKAAPPSPEEAGDPRGGDRPLRGRRHSGRFLCRARQGRPRSDVGAQHLSQRRARLGEPGRRGRVEPEPGRERLLRVLEPGAGDSGQGRRPPRRCDRHDGHLKPGTSWFNLRTLGKNGRWTSTVHLGPFLILPDTVVPETTITGRPAQVRHRHRDVRIRVEREERDAGMQPRRNPVRDLRVAEDVYRPHQGEAHVPRPRGRRRRERRPDAGSARMAGRQKGAGAPKLTEAPNAFSQDDARFEFTASEKNSSFECKLDEGDYETCSSPKTYAGLDDGGHRFRVRAVDQAGNPDASPASRKWTVDTSPPETSIDAGPPRNSHRGSATFTVSSEAGASFECRLDGHAWGECGQVSGLSDGKHIMRARAKDRAGNVDPTPARWSWRIDLPPETTITAGPTGPTSSASATFRFSSPDTAATFQCRLDGRSWAACSSGRTYSGLPQGSHTFRVRAKDSAGTNDPSPAQRKLDGGHGRAEHHDHLGTEGIHRLEVGDLLVLRVGERGDLRVPPRRRRLAGVLFAEDLQRAEEGRARLPRPCGRRGRQRRRTPDMWSWVMH